MGSIDQGGSEKDIVLLSGGFLQTCNTCTNQRIQEALEPDYVSLGFDNAGHGNMYPLEFSQHHQKQIVLQLLNKTTQPFHLVGNSIPGMYMSYALGELLQKNAALVKERVKTFTLLAPAINTGDALDHGFQCQNKFIQSLYHKKYGRILVLNPLLKLLKGVHADINDLYLWAHEDKRYAKNQEILSLLANKIPTHIIYNQGDIVVRPDCEENDFRDFAHNHNISLSTIDSNRVNKHAIYPQDDRISGNNRGTKNYQTVGSTIKTFISQHT